MKVIKRDGSVVEFDRNKIKTAISKCGKFDNDTLSSIVESVVKRLPKSDNLVTIDIIQKIVENTLMQSGYYDEARDYICYRYLHDVAREKYYELVSAIKTKLYAQDVQNQNANVDEKSFGGRKGEMANYVLNQFALEHCMSEKSKNNHINNEIYIHDLDSYALGLHNCLTLPIDDLFKNGFNTRQVDIRPAQSINTAFQLLAVVFQLQSLQQFGGVSVSHLDWSMVPYVRKSFYKHFINGMKYIESNNTFSIENVEDISISDDVYKSHVNVYNYAYDMTDRELYQAVEGMYHNLNSLQSRSGNQLPFSSINYGTCTLIEGRMVIKALLDSSIKGVGKFHKTSVFPCGIFQCMKGVNREEGEPNYDLFLLALKSTARRLYPNYCNVDWSINKGYDKNNPATYNSTMGCRTYTGYDINGFGQLKDGRGNICPVTIILPTLAMQAKEKNECNCVEEFMNLLEIKIEEAKDMLIERYEYICGQPVESALFMYENNTMAGYIPEEGIRSALKHGSLAMGQLGLAETLQILIGKNHTTDDGMKLAKRIEQLFKDKCAYYKQKYKLNIGVYYSPAENLCYTAMKKFKDKYGVIPNVSDKKYFTNSMHIPVWEKVDVFEKIDLESQLTNYSNAGCITYVELDASVLNNIKALETIVNYAMDKDIPYFAVNVPNDTCNNCGYCGEISDSCPSCGSKDIKRLRRVTGYLTSDYKTAFNAGKQEEVEMRVKHSGVIAK